MTWLYHYTQKEFTLNRDMTYGSTNRIGKPCGLWLSDDLDYGWNAWCTQNEWPLGHIRYQCELNMQSVLHLSTRNEIKDFAKEYKPSFKPLTMMHDIDWAAVQRKYKGVLISPYQWELRLIMMWYYGWDCASACVWDLTAVESFIKYNPS